MTLTWNYCGEVPSPTQRLEEKKKNEEAALHSSSTMVEVSWCIRDATALRIEPALHSTSKRTRISSGSNRCSSKTRTCNSWTPQQFCSNSTYREWAALRNLRSSTRHTMLTVGSSTVQGFSARQNLCRTFPVSTLLFKSTFGSWPEGERTEINMFAHHSGMSCKLNKGSSLDLGDYQGHFQLPRRACQGSNRHSGRKKKAHTFHESCSRPLAASTRLLKFTSMSRPNSAKSRPTSHRDSPKDVCTNSSSYRCPNND